MTALALIGARIFDGDAWHDDSALVVHAGQVEAIARPGSLPPDARLQRVQGGRLVPGFVDVQVNGGGGVLLNESPTVEAMGRIAQAHAALGTCRLLPTLVTAPPTIVDAALRAARQAPAGVLGLHLEGPHLGPRRRGVHDPALMAPLGEAEVERLLAAGVPRLLVTVAAEQVTPAQVRRLVDGGIFVSLGHSDASYEQAMALFEAGATGATHLFNAMSPLQGRAPGLVGAALESAGVWAGMIADGHHVSAASLRIALRAKRGPGRLFLVSDAMPTVGAAIGSFRLGERLIERRGDRLVWRGPAGEEVLAGAHLALATAIRFCVAALEVPLDEALRMAALYPARFLRLDDRHGRLAPGRPADIVHLDDTLQVRRTWVAGTEVAPAG
ncbi:MAG: N-acetylglucosamine-6-phosphate deacetylase [Reyranellaceae bacterium]